MIDPQSTGHATTHRHAVGLGRGDFAHHRRTFSAWFAAKTDLVDSNPSSTREARNRPADTRDGHFAPENGLINWGPRLPAEKGEGPASRKLESPIWRNALSKHSTHRSTVAEILATAARLAELAATLVTEPTPDTSNDALLPESAIIARRPGVSGGWLRGHVAAVGRGARRCRLYRLADVDQALASAPVPPCPRKCGLAVDEEDPLEAMLRSGALVARRGVK